MAPDSSVRQEGRCNRNVLQERTAATCRGTTGDEQLREGRGDSVLDSCDLGELRVRRLEQGIHIAHDAGSSGTIESGTSSNAGRHPVLAPRMKLIQGGKKVLPSKSQTQTIVRNSEMRVLTSPEWFYCEIHGDAAKIPALKNRKRAYRGRMITDPETMERIHALDILYKQTENNAPVPYWEKTKLSLVAIFGKGNRIDRDNGVATIKDWLEPPTKRTSHGIRGWGIGIYKNDSKVIPHPLRCADIGIEQEHTTIVVMPYENVKDLTMQLVARHMRHWG